MSTKENYRDGSTYESRQLEWRTHLKDCRELAWKWVQDNQDDLPINVRNALITMCEFHKQQAIRGLIH